MLRTTIVIPCYNEADRLDIDGFRDFRVEGITLLFVDDGSRDATRSTLDSLVATGPARMAVLPLDENGGKAEAVRRGFLHAFETGADAVGFWDADLATPLAEIDRFRAALADQPQLEVIYGSRVNLLGRSVHRNLMRHYIGRVFATAAATVLELGIYDTQCGAKLFRVNDRTKALFAEPFLSRWIFDVELIARMIRQQRDEGAPGPKSIMAELPLMAWRDVGGSKIRLRDFLIVACDLVRIRVRYLGG